MTALIYKTKNYSLIERLDVKIFGKAEVCDKPYEKVTWFLLTVDDKIAGFAGIYGFTENGEQLGCLERSGLLKPYRGKGLQSAMIDVRLKEARRQGWSEVFTYTNRHNYPSSNNLVKAGFRLYDPYHKYGLKDALYWYKKV